MIRGVSRGCDSLAAPTGYVGHGAVLYDTRPRDRRACCRDDTRQRHLAHVTGIYEELRTGVTLFVVEDGTHTTREEFHADDLLSLFEPAGFALPTGVRPTYLLTREYGLRDGHDRMQRHGGETA